MKPLRGMRVRGGARPRVRREARRPWAVVYNAFGVRMHGVVPLPVLWIPSTRHRADWCAVARGGLGTPYELGGGTRRPVCSCCSLPRSGYIPQPRVAALRGAPWVTMPISHDTPKAFHKRRCTVPQSLVQLYTHLVFSTKLREPYLRDDELRGRLHAYLAGACRNLDSPSLIVGGVEDHVHILCRMSKTKSVAELIRELKRESSKWVKDAHTLGSICFNGRTVTARSPPARLTFVRSRITSPIKRNIIRPNHSRMNSVVCAANMVSISTSVTFGMER